MFVQRYLYYKKEDWESFKYEIHEEIDEKFTSKAEIRTERLVYLTVGR